MTSTLKLLSACTTDLERAEWLAQALDMTATMLHGMVQAEMAEMVDYLQTNPAEEHQATTHLALESADKLSGYLRQLANDLHKTYPNLQPGAAPVEEPSRIILSSLTH